MRIAATIAAAAAGLLSLGLGGQAAAVPYVFAFDEPREGGSQEAGSYEALSFAYDDEGPVLDVSGSVRLNTANGTISGGWFALTPGGDPRETDEQVAIFYMDFVSGRVSAYRYDGRQGETGGVDSWQQDDLFIASWANAITTSVTDGVLSFSIPDLDVTAVQNASSDAGWTGVSFAERVGIWLHLTPLQEIAFDAEGKLTAYRTGVLASFDAPNAGTTAMPLPGAALFVLTGLAGLAALRGRRAA